MTRSNRVRSALRKSVGATAVLLATMAATDAKADDTKPRAPLLILTGTPAFGADAVVSEGWFEIIARVENPSAMARRGTLLLVREPSWRSSENRSAARVPFSVAAGGSTVVHIPAHGMPSYMPMLTLSAVADDETPLASVELSITDTPGPILVDIANPSRLATALKGSTVSVDWDPTRRGRAPARTLGVGAPTFDPKTGEPLLPIRTEGYASATVVVIHSDVLAHLEAEPLDALVHWVLSGGSLAVVPTRPEDLRGPVMSRLAGGPVHANRGAAAIATMLAPAPTPLLVTTTPDDDGGGDDDDAVATTTGNADGTDDTKTPSTLAPNTPPEAVKSRLVGYAGGALRASFFGASTSYGLGEVHLLGFDPAERPMVDDAWAHARLRALVEHAWERNARSAFHHGGAEGSRGDTTEIRRALDPNESFRAPLALAAVLLVLYSILVGPVLFLRAARMGRPLAPLVQAPLLSALTFGLIVFVGLAGKGFRGRARRIALVEAQEGAQSGPIRRYRGFFSSRAEALTIAATDRSCLVDVASVDTTPSGQGVLRIDRNGVALDGLTSLPWQTVVVREDGMFDLGDGVSLSENTEGDVTVENLTPYAIADAIIYSTHKGFFHFPSLPPRSKTLTSSGRFLNSVGARDAVKAGTTMVHRLDAQTLRSPFPDAVGARIYALWHPIELAAGDAVDWYPDDAPVLLGELTKAESGDSDSGLRLESNHVLVRILGHEVTP